MSDTDDFPKRSGRKRIIGIVGGMGPVSGLHLCSQILSLTKADSDQDHCSFILMSLPERIADRSAFLAGECPENPAYQIVKIIRKLEAVGANIIGICCNTAHSPEIFDVILTLLDQKGSKVKILNMPAETCNEVFGMGLMNKRVGLMCTNGTAQSKVYETLIRKIGHEPILPGSRLQNDVIHRSVYDPVIGIKANAGKNLDKARSLLNEAISFFEEQHAETVILACTEFSLLGMQSNNGMYFIDSSKSFAKALLREVVSV